MIPAHDEQGRPHIEPHYSPEQIAESWGMSLDFVRRLFRNEPGSVVFCNPRPGRRVYRTLRIPASVADRVHRRFRVCDQDQSSRIRASSRSRRDFTKCE
jgi:hypothetical protein